MTKDLNVYVQVMADSVERIRHYAAGMDFDDFCKDMRTQDAILRNLEIIGQAVKDYGRERLAQEEPSIPWKRVAGLRDVLAHAYLSVSLALVWEVVATEMPKLDEAIARLTKNTTGGTGGSHAGR